MVKKYTGWGFVTETAKGLVEGLTEGATTVVNAAIGGEDKFDQAKKNSICPHVENLMNELTETLAHNMGEQTTDTTILTQRKDMIQQAYKTNNSFTSNTIINNTNIDKESTKAALNLLSQLHTAKTTWENSTRKHIATGGNDQLRAGTQSYLDNSLLEASKNAIKTNNKLINKELSWFQKAINNFTQAVLGFETYQSKKANAFNKEPVLSKLRDIDPDTPTIKPR